MASNKPTKPKSQETMETVGAKLRLSNRYHDAEIQMLAAIGATHGLKMSFNEKEGTVTIEQDVHFRPTESTSSSSLPGTSQVSPASICYTLDKSKLLDELKPVIASAIKACLQEHPIQAVASVDRSVLLANNDIVMQLVNTKWNQWFEQKKARLQNTGKPKASAQPRPQPQVAFRSGDDVVYKVPEEELYGPKSTSESPKQYRQKKSSPMKRLLVRIYEDMISCWWKAGAYIVCLCSLTCCGYLGYKNYRMNNIVKEYGILKPALMHHRDFREFMKSLDEVLNEDDIDDVLKRLDDREKKSK